jgi:hypothetical protein
MSKSDQRSLLNEFQKAQRSEAAALEHRQGLELKELKASQAARLKEWEAQDHEARRKYFQDHPKGEEKRAWIRDSRERHKALLSLYTEERNQRTHDFEVRRKSVKDDQAAKLKEFQEYLKKGEKPPQRLWPSGNS